MTYKIGQQVVCIEDKWETYPPEYSLNTYPIKKGVYTIWGINSHDIGKYNHCGYPIRQAMLLFDEIYFFGKENNLRPGWRCDWFRPVKQTSIEIFEKISNTNPASFINKTPVRKPEKVE